MMCVQRPSTPGTELKPDSLLPPVLAFLEHVLDRGFIDHQVGGAVAVQLDAVFVIPLDIAMHLFAVAQHDDHRSLTLHLLLVVKILGVSLLARHALFDRSSRRTVSIPVSVSVSAFGGDVVVAMVIVRAIGAIKGRADQLAIREVILIRNWFGWHGLERIFQNAPPVRWAGKSATTLELDCGPEV